MIGAYVVYKSDPGQATPADRAEWARKFGDCSMTSNAACVDCGLSWSNHYWFFCYEASRAYWKRTPTSSVCDSNQRITAETYLGAGSPASAPVLAPAVSISNSKEDQMFQVSTYLFASGTVTSAQFGRLEDAEANLEKVVAGYRQASATANKVFFTASILDTKTGKYYGFVSDAPPAVELQGASE